jgi:HTH-type transcriptional regulator/antitoxin HigA
LEYYKEKLVGMEIEKINNEEDYQNVLQRIDTLMNAKPGSPEYEELQHLTDLIEDYEDGLCS